MARQQEHSIKDEILTILISAIFIFTFLPFSQPYMTKGFEILKSAPTEFWWAVLIVFCGSFGMSTLKKHKGEKNNVRKKEKTRKARAKRKNAIAMNKKKKTKDVLIWHLQINKKLP